MAELIEEVRAYAGIPEDKMVDLKEEDAEPLNKYTALKPIVYIDKTIDRGGSRPLRLIEEFSIKKNLNHHYDAVNKHLATMLNNPMAVDANKKLLDMLSQIRTVVGTGPPTASGYTPQTLLHKNWEYKNEQALEEIISSSVRSYLRCLIGPTFTVSMTVVFGFSRAF